MREFKFVLLSLFIAGSATTGYSQQIDIPPGIDIDTSKIQGHGEGCRTLDDDTKTWRAVYNKKKMQLKIIFDEFKLEDKEDGKRASCSLTILAKYPPGKALYVYQSRVFGEAEIARGESGSIKTRLSLPSREYGWTKPLNLEEGFDDMWKTDVNKYKGAQETPCGSAALPIEFQIVMRRTGTKSYMSVENNTGRFTNLQFNVEECDK